MISDKSQKMAPEEEKPSSIICEAMDILYVLEMNLSFYAWYKHGEPYPIHDLFHEHLHKPVDIYMFGSPQNYDNSPTEHGLIETAKQPADHVQKSNIQFVSQVTK